MSGMTVRAPRPSDVPAVNRICFETGYSEQEVAESHPTPDLLGLVWADPYLAFAPDWCRVAVDGRGVAGYLLAVPSTRDFDRWAHAEWWPPLREDHPVDESGLSPADRAVARLLASPPSSPEHLLDRFPAHLHIDFLPRARGLGLARRLIDDLVDRLAAAGVPGVHLGVSPQNTNAIGFYEHLGFERLQTEPDTIWMGRRTGADPAPFPRSPASVPRWTAQRATTPPDLDGRLAAECWSTAVWTPRFVDLVDGREVHLETRAAILWDDHHLYVGFRLEEPDVTATLTERDSHVWLDDDVELFVAGPDAYYELEVNAFGTVYEVLFAWDGADTAEAFAGDPTLQRDHPRAAPFGGVGFPEHPRGPRTGFWGFDLPGLRTAVHVDGTVNDASDVDRGWSVEIAVPWASLRPLAGGRALPPRDGDEWRIALCRFNTRRRDDSGGWSWSPHGVWDSHIPELFPIVRFSTG